MTLTSACEAALALGLEGRQARKADSESECDSSECDSDSSSCSDSESDEKPKKRKSKDHSKTKKSKKKERSSKRGSRKGLCHKWARKSVAKKGSKESKKPGCPNSKDKCTYRHFFLDDAEKKKTIPNP